MAVNKIPTIIRRSLLYVPASSPKMLTKSLGVHTDNVTYDLEDSVTDSLKETARQQLRTHLKSIESRPSPISEIAVRINAVSTKFAHDDLTTLASVPQIDAVVVPKVQGPKDLEFVTDMLKHFGSTRSNDRDPIRIIALIESAQAIMNLKAICESTLLLSGLIFAAEDFALDLSLARTPSLQEFLYARSAIVTAARAAALPSAIDLVCTSYRGEEGLKTLEEECRGGKSMGFNGKQCIHPSQVETVQKMFAPSQTEVDWAMRISVANQKAEAQGRGAWTMDDKMIDAPVIGKANAILARAEQCGFDLRHQRDRWSKQEPE